VLLDISCLSIVRLLPVAENPKYFLFKAGILDDASSMLNALW
jgi:hypothetical protein